MAAPDPFELDDWRGRAVRATRSPSGVLLLLDYADNLVRVAQGPWPPPALVAKLGESHHAQNWAAHIARPARERLGHYCALQSINSEDAATWSFFGPLMDAPADMKSRFITWLLSAVGIACKPATRCTIDLWRRIPHPEKPSSPGPELDVVLDGDQAVVFVEAKWGSPEDVGQGLAGTSTQMGLRRDFLERHGRRIYGDRRFVVLGVVVADAIEAAPPPDSAHVVTKTITWAELCRFAEHPAHEELRPYLDWKLRHSTVKGSRRETGTTVKPSPPATGAAAAKARRWWVPGVPATFATAGEQPWKDAIATHVSAASEPTSGGLALEFVVAGAQHGRAAADLDNLLEPVCSTFVNRLGWLGGRRPNIEWIRATKRYDQPTGLTIEIKDTPPPPLSGTGDDVLFEGVFAGPLPKHARDPAFANWISGTWHTQPRTHVAVALRFGAPRINLGEIATGPVKAAIDGLWPVLGGHAGSAQDWRIRELQLERGAADVPPVGVAVTVAHHRG